MINFLIIIFIVTLLYAAKNELVKQYILILGLQGLILFGVAILELKEINVPHLVLILLETLLFKAIFVPLFLRRLAKRSKIHKNTKSLLSKNASIVMAVFIIGMSFTVAHLLHDEHLEIKYFAAAISSIAIGLFIAINHKDILTHLISFLILENGIFLLSLALGSEMPMFVNAAILLDIFSTVLIMGMFFNKVNQYFDQAHIDKLTQLKD